MKIPTLLLSLALTTAALNAAETWMTDFKAAQAAAKKDGKAILIDFTGSDWCSWCKKMKKESLDQAAFKEYAAKNLILVEADFPQTKVLSPELKKQNGELQSKYKVNGFPTFVLINADGKLLGKQEGYLEGGPTAFVEAIQGWVAKK